MPAGWALPPDSEYPQGVRPGKRALTPGIARAGPDSRSARRPVPSTSPPGVPPCARSPWRFLVLLPLPVLANPITPAIDDGPDPFCYFSRPSTVLGVPDSTEGNPGHRRGWLWTGSAQLAFFTGPELTPLRQRIQTLQDGSLPIVSHVTLQGDLRYGITMFAATLDGHTESPLVNFIRVRVTNCGSGTRKATFATAIRPRARTVASACGSL